MQKSYDTCAVIFSICTFKIKGYSVVFDTWVPLDIILCSNSKRVPLGDHISDPRMTDVSHIAFCQEVKQLKKEIKYKKCVIFK